MAGTFTGSSEQKPIKNFRDKGGGRGRIQGLPKFFRYPLLSQEQVKLRTSNFVRTFIGSTGTKATVKISRKITMGVLRDSQKFPEHRIVRSSLR